MSINLSAQAKYSFKEKPIGPLKGFDVMWWNLTKKYQWYCLRTGMSLFNGGSSEECEAVSQAASAKYTDYYGAHVAWWRR